MKNRLFAAVSLAVLSMSLVVPAAAVDTKTARKRRAQASPLVSLLPASDAVVTVNAKRFFVDAVPRILSGNEELLKRFMSTIDEVQAASGIDLRQFDSLAAGMTIRGKGPKDFVVDPVAFARGAVNAPALVAAAKVAANGKYRQETLGARTLIIFTVKDLVAARAKTTDPKMLETIDKSSGKMAGEIAVAVFDANTIAIGRPARVRDALAARTHVSPDLLSMLGRSEGSIMDFAAKVPAGVSWLLPLQNDELGRNIDAIRYLYGSISYIGDTVAIRSTARTDAAAAAQGLYETLSGLQIMGKAFLSGAGGADKQVYLRLIDNAKFAVSGNEVAMELRVQQSDIDVLARMVR
ncbi:MAG: hypothetical protein ACR2IH_11685 [Pyrinomonadaceae bacterium]